MKLPLVGGEAHPGNKRMGRTLPSPLTPFLFPVGEVLFWPPRGEGGLRSSLR